MCLAIVEEKRDIADMATGEGESENYKANVSAEEFEKTKTQYDRAKFRLRILSKEGR